MPHPSSAVPDYIHLPDTIASEIRPDDGTSSIASLNVEFPDTKQRFTRLIAERLYGKRVRIRAGYDNIPQGDFVTIFTGVLDHLSMRANELSYDTVIRSADALSNKEIYISALTTLAAPLSAGATSMTVQNAEEFIEADIEFPGFVHIDDEIIAYTGKTATTLTGLIRGGLADIIPTNIPAAHAAGARVKEGFVIGPQHPMVSALDILRHETKGAAIPEDLLDVPAFELAQEQMGEATLHMYVEGPINCKTFLEQELYKPFSCYHFVKATGEISVRFFKTPAPGSGIGVLDESMMVGTPSWDKGWDRLINAVTYYHDWNPLSGHFEASTTFIDEDSIEDYGKVVPFVVESRGLYLFYEETLDLMQSIALARLQRYRDGCPRIVVPCFMQKHLWEIGDVIELTSSVIPNADTQVRGIEGQLWEITNKQVRIREGHVVFELTSAGLPDPAVAPPSAPEFGSATEYEQASYFYVAAAGGANPDGSDAHEIDAGVAAIEGTEYAALPESSTEAGAPVDEDIFEAMRARDQYDRTAAETYAWV